MAKKRAKAASAAVPNKPLRLTGSGVVLVGDNNGCYTRGQTVYFYIDPPDPGPYCYYFFTVYSEAVDSRVRHVTTGAVTEADKNEFDFPAFKFVPEQPAAYSTAKAAKAVAVANVCEFYLLVVTRVCFGGAPTIIGSVPFRVCDVCP